MTKNNNKCITEKQMNFTLFTESNTMNSTVNA